MSQQLFCIPKLWIEILEYALTLAPLASLLSSCRLNGEEEIDINRNPSFPLNFVACSLHIPKGISDLALPMYRHSFYLVLIAGTSVVQTYVRRNTHYSVVALLRVALKLKYFMICTFIFAILFELWSEHYLFWNITSLAENILFSNLIDKLEKGTSTDAVKEMRKLKELTIICRLFPSFSSHIRTVQQTLIGTLKQYPRILPNILIFIFMWHWSSLFEHAWRYHTSGNNSVQLTLIVSLYNTLFVIYAL